MARTTAAGADQLGRLNVGLACGTLQEIDYIGEGRNADRFRRNFSGVDWVEAPQVFWGLTSPRVITLQYLPGVKVAAQMPSLSAAPARHSNTDTRPSRGPK